MEASSKPGEKESPGQLPPQKVDSKSEGQVSEVCRTFAAKCEARLESMQTKYSILEKELRELRQRHREEMDQRTKETCPSQQGSTTAGAGSSVPKEVRELRVKLELSELKVASLMEGAKEGA